jgi:predicted  nucleic acid-binding Zn-ribbon protein
LQATRAKLEELSAAVSVNSKLRKEVEALKKDNQRLTTELAEASSRQSEAESARARIAELTKGVEAARAQSGQLQEALNRLQRQDAELNQSVSRARAAREAADARAAKTQAEMTSKLKEAVDVAARAKAELSAAQDHVSQAADAAVEAERARQAAVREAAAVRNEAARARQALAEATTEIDRLKDANAAMAQQIASLQTESQSATQAARQNLVLMGEKIAALKAALGSTLSDDGVTQSAPKPEAVPPEAERATAAPATLVTPPRSEPTPARDPEADQPEVPATNAAAAPPAAASVATDRGQDLAGFYANVEALNGLEAGAGTDLFSGIQSVDGRVVQISATAAWDSLPAVGQQTYLETLLEAWIAAHGGQGPAVVRIVDQNGRVVSETSTP